MLDDDSAALVYFSTDSDKPHINTLLGVADEHREYINCVWYQVSNLDELKLNFRSASYLPMFRSFKNVKTGDDKRDTSVQVYIQEDDVYTAIVE